MFNATIELLEDNGARRFDHVRTRNRDCMAVPFLKPAGKWPNGVATDSFRQRFCRLRQLGPERVRR